MVKSSLCIDEQIVGVEKLFFRSRVLKGRRGLGNDIERGKHDWRVIALDEVEFAHAMRHKRVLKLVFRGVGLHTAEEEVQELGVLDTGGYRPLLGLF